jgi:hypothetical protein
LTIHRNNFCILGIEAKSVEPDSKNVLKKVEDASEQLAKRNSLLTRLHSNILTSDWTYVRAVALPMIPSLESWEQEQPALHQIVCDYCHQFILDLAKLNDSLADWIDFIIKSSPKAPFPVDEQYV